MRPSSNRFAKLALSAAVGACSAASAGAAPAGAAPPSAPPAAAAGAASAAPVAERAAQQFAHALELMKTGRNLDAELEFKQMAVTYPDLPGPQIDLGLLMAHAARLNEAQSVFEAVLERHPDNTIANAELGIVERRLGKFAEAQSRYERAIAADPNYAPAHLNLGILYDLYLGEPQKALAEFERYVALAGENKQVAGWIADLRKRTGAVAPTSKEPS